MKKINNTDSNLRDNFFYKHRIITVISICLLIYLPLDFIAGCLLFKWLHRKQTPTDRSTPTLRLSNSYYHHGFSSNFKGKEKWGDYTYSISTNSLCFKDKDARVIKPQSDAYRIIFIGDSFTEGIGIPFEKTFVGIIGDYFADQDIEVLNAAAVSYSPKLSYFKIKYLIEDVKLKINELHVFIDVSDIVDEIIYGDFVPEHSSIEDMFPEGKNYRPFVGRFYVGRLSLFEYSLSYRSWVKLWLKEDPWKRFTYIQKKTGEKVNFYFCGERTAWLFNKPLYEDWGKDGYQSCEYYMKKLIKLGEKNNFTVTLFVYPWPTEIANKSVHSLNVKLWKTFSDSVGIKFVNLYPLFINETDPDIIYKKYFIPNDIHWNENGHEEVAKWWISNMSPDKINVNYIDN